MAKSITEIIITKGRNEEIKDIEAKELIADYFIQNQNLCTLCSFASMTFN